MIKALSWIAIFMLGGTVMASAMGQEARGNELNFYIAPNGSDEFSGKLQAPNSANTDGPFATLQRGRDAIRELKRRQDGMLKQSVNVFIRGGTYFLDEPLVFAPEDSGTSEYPITFAAYGNETPVISGGRAITGWKKGEKGLWVTELPEVKAGGWNFRQIFVMQPGQNYFRRRYRPSKGAFVIAGLTDAPAKESRMAHRRSQDEFRFSPGDIERWERLEDVEIVALHDWSASRLRIDGLDMENNVVKFTGFPVYRIGHWYRNSRNPYYVENVREALGEPGEWYLDRPTGVLAYRPLPGEDMETLTVVAPRLEQLVRLDGDIEKQEFVEHLSFQGLTFSHTAWALPPEGYSSGQGMVNLTAAISAQASRYCKLSGCTLAHLGTYAVELGAGCHENSVVGNRMFDLGGGGVKVGVTDANANPPVLPAGNLVANNVISDGALVHYSVHGIWVGIASSTRVSHNVVRRFLYSNVSVGWAWHDKPTSCRDNVIEYNHIHDAMMLLADGGGIYTLGFQPGTVLRGNLIHDVHRSPFTGRAPNNGIFLDQGSKAYLVEENIIYNTADQLIRFNQSKQELHTFRNNHLGISPQNPAFPGDAAAKAGLDPEYGFLDAESVEVTPTPILSMTLPPPPPPPSLYADDFEDTAVGGLPKYAKVQGEGKGASIRVTDETPASGKHCLKFTDAPGLSKSFYPYMWYEPSFDKGIARISFALRVEEGAVISIEGRDTSKNPYSAGPSIELTTDGQVKVGNQSLLKFPFGEWFRIELTCALGDPGNEVYELLVTLPGKQPQRFEKLPLVKPGFGRLDWFGITSLADHKVVFYVDDVKIAKE